MAAEPSIIIKRVKKVQGHGHHGGAWKIAYADFVTAMMAFFLLMWLLTTTTEEQRRGISDYFENPIAFSLLGGSGIGDQTRPIPGGGEDFRFTEGEVTRADPITMREEEELELALRAQEEQELERLKQEIEAAIDESPSLSGFRDQLLIDLTDEGLRIQIVDLEGRPMFEIGSSQLQVHARAILAELATLFNRVGNRISISGHTDAAPFAGGEFGFSNWELSNDRANAARRELISAGLEPGKILRIVGLASTTLLDQDDPLNPINRRISIVVVNRATEQAFIRQQLVEPAAQEEGAGIAELLPD